MSWKIPGGPRKGTPIREATDDDLRFWLRRTEDGLEKAPNGQYADMNRKWLAAAKEELAKRGGSVGAPQAQSSQTQALARSLPDPATSAIVCTALASAAAVTEALCDQAQKAHLVSPATSCGSLPEGCEVAISAVRVDPSESGGEVYPVAGGKLGLAKVALDKIGAAAGVTWDPALCGRQDDGRDPHYCHYKAVGYVRNFDGSVRVITGEKEMDLRDGSPQVEALDERVREKAERARRDGKKPAAEDASKQIREMRLHILSHAESKAKLRAIRSLGIKSSYQPAELRKPFAVARLMWTGRSADPELRRAFALKQADAMIGATSMLYGGVPRETAPLPAQFPSSYHPNTPRLHAAPPVGAVPADDGAIDTDWSYGEPDPEPAQPAPKSDPSASKAAQPTSADQERGGRDPDNADSY